MLNFAAQAARDCRLIEGYLRAHGLPDDAATAGGLADRIARAEHFELPDGGYLFDDDLHALVEQIAAATAVAESLLSMLSALACSNVTAEIAERVDPKVNERRTRAGKLPIFETRVLTVLCPRAPINRTGQQGDRASPRQHLRRGHVRHLPDGRRIWINAAIVGDPANGRIRKFYDVRTAA
ncbi:MAG: hypothetical protein E6R10_07170 [Rhodocyclaceae bacterium]|nr:MAG: hypothetical protein E6R10_07170 [Rhodocyclaceae bacterium]